MAAEEEKAEGERLYENDSGRWERRKLQQMKTRARRGEVLEPRLPAWDGEQLVWDRVRQGNDGVDTMINKQVV